MFQSTSFQAPDFNMGDDGGALLRGNLRYKNNQKRIEDNERAAFESAQMHLKRKQEQENLAQVMRANSAVTPDRGILAGVNGIIGGVDPVRPGGEGTGRVATGRVADPSLSAYRMGQLELGRDKLDLARDTAEGKQTVAERGVGVRESLAALKDLPESERLKRLQDGRMTLAEYNATAAMNRVVKTGEIDTAQIDQQAGHVSKLADKNNAARIERTKEGGYQSRLTKQTPEAPRNPTEGDLKIQLQRKAVAAINRNPALNGVISWNDQGFPIINEDADPQLQLEAAQALNQPAPDRNLPASGMPTTPLPSTSPASVSPVTQPSAVQPRPSQPLPANQYGVIQATDTIKPAPASGQTRKEYSPSRNQTRITNDGGKTWQVLPGKQ